MALAALLGTRIAVLLLGVAAVVLVGTMPPPTAEALWRVSPNEVWNLLARWDTQYYYSIATAGYHWDPAIFLHDNIVFFPLYPLLMRAGAWLVGSPLVAGLIVSLAAFGAAIVLVHRLAALELGDAYATPVVALLATYPFAFFYSAVYTESLFLLATVGAFYAMRRRALTLVAIAGLVAGLTRPNGWWLTVPLVAMSTAEPERRGSAIAASLMPIVGAAIFSAYTFSRFGGARSDQNRSRCDPALHRSDCLDGQHRGVHPRRRGHPSDHPAARSSLRAVDRRQYFSARRGAPVHLARPLHGGAVSDVLLAGDRDSPSEAPTGRDRLRGASSGVRGVVLSLASAGVIRRRFSERMLPPPRTGVRQGDRAGGRPEAV